MTRAGSRLTLVISSLQPGGAERVMSHMASYWAARGRDVTLVSFDRADAVPFYPLHPAVRVVALGLIGESASPIDALIKTVWRVARVRRALKESRPDAIVSFLDQVNVVTLLAARGLPAPVIAAERSHPAHSPLKRQWTWLRARTYPWAKWVVVQTPEARDFFTDPRVRTVIVPNIIKPSPVSRDAAPPTTPWITAVGRLGPEKGFDLLLAAFAKIAAAHPGWRLRIVGGGPLAEALARQARELGIEARVSFTGRVSDVFPLLASSELFVMSSRYEGFPNALGEAMAAGLPVVSFDCPSGPRALIRHGVDGVLVPPEDVDALARAIDRLIQHPAERAALASRAIEVTDRFSEEAIMRRWEDLLERAPGG